MDVTGEVQMVHEPKETEPAPVDFDEPMAVADLDPVPEPPEMIALDAMQTRF